MAEVKNKLSVSVGIPAYNEEANIGRLLRSVLNQKQESFFLKEIFVISDASGDKTAEEVRGVADPKINFRENTERVGQALNQNKMIEQHTGEILVFLNADVLPKDEYFLETMVAPFRTGQRIGIVGAKITPIRAKTFFERVINFSVALKQDIFENINGGDNLYLCHGRARAFSEEFLKKFRWPPSVNEDAYSYLACINEGFAFYYEPRAEVFYQSPKTLKDHLRQSVRFLQGIGKLQETFDAQFIRERHKIPASIFIRKNFKFFIRNPLLYISYVAVFIISAVSSLFKNRAIVKWEPSQSSKLVSISMEICFFGSYEKNYSRNQILLKGLRKNGVIINEVHLELPVVNIDKSEHISIFSMLARAARKLKIIPVILGNLRAIRRSDIILAAYPSHLDVPAAYILSKIFGKPLIFDPMYGLAQMFVDEFGLAEKKSMKSRLLKFADKVIFLLPDTLLFSSDLICDYYQKMFNISPARMAVLPFGADSDLYKYSGILEGGEVMRVIYYGLYNPMHGVEYIVECASMCRDQNIEFLMIGSGQTYEENRSRADSLGLKNIKFLPKVTEKDAKEYLDSGDIFLGFLNKSAISEREIPNKVFQGLAMGKVVLTAATSVTRAAFKHKENIYLCEPNNASSLLAAIMELKGDPALREKIAKNGYELYSAVFTPEKIGKRLVEICNTLLMKKR